MGHPVMCRKGSTTFNHFNGLDEKLTWQLLKLSLRSPQDGPVGAEVPLEFGDVLRVVLPGLGVPLEDGARLVRRHESLQERDLKFRVSDAEVLYWVNLKYCISNTTVFI